jgi:hypothetical protein
VKGRPSGSATQAPPRHGRLVGREHALGELRDCFGRALCGERQIVFVTGEPGIGKTALAECVEGYGGKEAYYPMVEALRELCRGSGGDAVVQTLTAQAPTWLVQFSALKKLNRIMKS